MQKPSYVTIITIVGYVASILVLLYPQTAEYILSLGFFYQLIILVLLLVGPASPMLFYKIRAFRNREKEYNSRLASLQKKEQEAAKLAASASFSKQGEPTADAIRSIIRALNTVCFDTPAPEFHKKDWAAETVRIPLYDDIPIEPKIGYLLALPIFQRLRYIRQLSFADLQFPGAAHCRIEHALGTYYLVRRMCEFLRKDLKLSVQDILFAEVASIIHDIGHSSMGHGLEPLCTLLPSAREDKRFDKIRLFRYLGDESLPLCAAIDKIGLDRKNLLRFFRNPETLEGTYIFLNDIIDSDVDADRIDYLNRDAYHANGPVARIDYSALVESARFVEIADRSSGRSGYKLVYLPKAAQAAHVLLIVRDAMYAKVYEGDIKTAAEEMVCHGLYAFYREYGLKEDDLEQILRLGDGDLLTILHLFGHEYERGMVESVISRQVYSVIGYFPISESSERNSFDDKLYQFARQLKATGFEEKIRIETVFCKEYLKKEHVFPVVFIRAPEELPPEEKTKEQTREEESKKPAILVEGKPVLLEDYLNTKISTSPERKMLRVYARSMSADDRKSILDAFKKFVAESAWKP